MTQLELRRYADANAFLDAVGGYLAAREAEHNLLLGLAGRLRTAPRLYGDEPYFAAVTAGKDIVAAALRTPPHNLVLSELLDLGAVEPLVADVADEFPDLPGVVGPKDASRRFVEVWQERTGRAVSLAIAQRIFRCERVIAPAVVGGSMRRALERDRRVVLDWIAAFIDEAFEEPPPRTAEEIAEDGLSRPGGFGLYLWDDDGPVSLAGCGRPTPNGVGIGPVYTPPESRGRGYASALVAELTELLLADRRFCFLYTDLANPTSNKIYQRVGYEPVTDADQYRIG